MNNIYDAVSDIIEFLKQLGNYQGNACFGPKIFTLKFEDNEIEGFITFRLNFISLGNIFRVYR